MGVIINSLSALRARRLLCTASAASRAQQLKGAAPASLVIKISSMMLAPWKLNVTAIAHQGSIPSSSRMLLEFLS